jgi:hypothetical protein
VRESERERDERREDDGDDVDDEAEDEADVRVRSDGSLERGQDEKEAGDPRDEAEDSV